jgi:Na+-driven multidrug efflux pump
VILPTFSESLIRGTSTPFSYTEASAALSPQIAQAISVLILFVLAIPHGIMSSMMFQGVGKGTYSLLITLLRSLILESVFAYLRVGVLLQGYVLLVCGI